jgi:hypothetical protein
VDLVVVHRWLQIDPCPSPVDSHGHAFPLADPPEGVRNAEASALLTVRRAVDRMQEIPAPSTEMGEAVLPLPGRPICVCYAVLREPNFPFNRKTCPPAGGPQDASLRFGELDR